MCDCEVCHPELYEYEAPGFEDPKVNKDRLLKLTRLRDVMRVVAKKPKGAFRQDTWGRKFKSVQEMEEVMGLEHKDTPPCKTVACVAGWGAQDRSLRRLGLKMVWEKFYGYDGKPIYEAEVQISGEEAQKIDYAKFFGISLDEAQLLFYEGVKGSDGTAARDVAVYLNKLIKKYTPPRARKVKKS